ncbi:MAG: monovalent cation/H(+) antiporter subunit G [Candidatus Binataceae bacterium]
MVVNPADTAEAILLFGGVALILLSCLGLFSGDAFDRMHYLGPATVLAPPLIAAAIIVRHASTAAVIKVILLALALMLASPVLTHATGESGFRRKSEREKNEKR